MRTTRAAELAAPGAAAVPLALLGAVPAWCVTVLLLLGAAIAVGHAVVTEIIRLRVSARILTSTDALHALSIQDLTRGRGQSA